MKIKKYFLIIIILIPAVVYACFRILVFIADNKATDPEKMIERYTDNSGGRFYRINSGINNSYLIPCKDGWLMVDTGYPEDYGRFRKAVASAGIDISSIKWLFITHAHDEHAGFAEALRKDTGCRIIVPEKSLNDLRSGQMVWTGKAVNRRIEFVSALYDIVKARDMKFPPIIPGKNDIILTNDDKIFLKGIGIEGTLMATPGHSDDSWSLLMDDGRAFCGDAAMNFLNLLGADYRPIFITNEKEVYNSLRKLLRSGAAYFYTGHGTAFGKEKIEEMLAEYKK
ncbi:MAG: MBL fold metallo-hydrolase [Spirochaetes bacterium]|nr:MBL fold metallo-hydrolase [Spirochaetota bacterium]